MSEKLNRIYFHDTLKSKCLDLTLKKANELAIQFY